MSGHKVVALLEERGDVFIHGGPLRRRKGTAVARERLRLQPSLAASPSSSSPTPAAAAATSVEFVVGTKCTYKIKSRGGAIVPSSSLSGDSTGLGSGEGQKGGGGVEEDVVAFDFDADAMMQAAQRGEDIPTAIRKAEAAARSRRRAKQHQQATGSTTDITVEEDDETQAPVVRGEAELTALKIKQGRSMLDVLWAQEHCYIKCVTPLTSVEADHELQQEREEEERREREELFHLMHDDDEFASNKHPATADADTMKSNSSKKKQQSDAERTVITGGVPSTISPNDVRINECLVNGFVVHFFNPSKPDPKPFEHLTDTGKAFASTLACGKYSSSAVCASSSSPSSSAANYDVSYPALRTRLYLSQTQYEQEEWCLVYGTAILNYWHERLEASVINAPEIFQYQVFGIDITGSICTSPSSPTAAAATASTAITTDSIKTIRQVGSPVHAVLSTSALYLVPRATKSDFERDDLMRTKRMPLEALQLVSVDKGAGTVWISGGPLRGGGSGGGREGVPIGFYSPGEAYDFVLELQRVWELAGGASGDVKFPYEIVVPSS